MGKPKGIMHVNPDTLSPQQKLYIDAFFRLGNKSAACREAGIDLSKSHNVAQNYHNNPAVLKEVTRRQKLAQNSKDYTLPAALDEALAAMEFARETRNASAMVKAAELRAKLSGHLVDKIDLNFKTPFTINIEGIGRPQLLPPATLLPPAQVLEKIIEHRREKEDFIDDDDETEEDIFS